MIYRGNRDVLGGVWQYFRGTYPAGDITFMSESDYGYLRRTDMTRRAVMTFGPREGWFGIRDMEEMTRVCLRAMGFV